MTALFALPFDNPERRSILTHSFFPPILMVIVGDPAASAGYTIAPMVFGDALNRERIRDLLVHHALFDAMDELSGSATNARHPCPWTSCRFHATRLCRGNFNPPPPGVDPEENCWFPERLRQLGKEMPEPFVLSSIAGV